MSLFKGQGLAAEATLACNMSINLCVLYVWTTTQTPALQNEAYLAFLLCR